ncbi:diguanylate cyclase [Piscinibacter sp. HJYY11]|uniref:GGDEF domain-containing protein n=1 Tax=Piscinibacter sp. HJYY11 TaxID=2801333 RepID=UPI00191F2713|nr:GGDEF domain-containing protein [Piscinibacter sp. HJYY11]MBL0728125.1 diguanylate cyclase [Piscinibacter sp. HJYY11]
MNLDIQTILVVLLANVMATAVALPLLMGWRVSNAARLFQGGMVVQGLSWALFLVAPRVHDRALTSVALGLLALSFAMLWSALQAWIGPRPGKRAMWGLVVAMPLVYAWAYPSYPARVGLSNAMFAAQMVLVCVALAMPAPHIGRRWRGLLLASFVALTIVTLWRGVLGAFFTEAYPFFRATHPVNVAAVFLNHVALSLCTLGLLAAWREEAERELRRQAQTDGLTGLLNRQAFLERAQVALAHATRYNEPLTLLMLDVDHFKRINDQHGHAAGDVALQTIATGLRSCVRAGDLYCRYGGEEFCVLLSRAEAKDAMRFDERLRGCLITHARDTGAEPLDYSAGVATRQASDTTMDALLLRADAALYQAKAEGRGRLVESPGPSEQHELKFHAAA